MKLTEEQKQQVAQKIKPRACQICGGNQWALADDIVEIRPYEQGNFSIGGGTPLIPAVMLACNGCHQLVLISAVATGIVPGG